jgi:RNA-directed DNA polymerase
MSGEVNISFVLDMQRKLYRWSNEDPDKVFVDLFNLVCDRRTLNEAWRRLARNSGSRTPGTDGMTRLTVERRPGGAAAFLEEIREALRDGTYGPEPVRQRLIPKPGKPGQFRPLGIPTNRTLLLLSLVLGMLASSGTASAQMEWQDLNLRPLRPERSEYFLSC